LRNKIASCCFDSGNSELLPTSSRTRGCLFPMCRPWLWSARSRRRFGKKFHGFRSFGGKASRFGMSAAISIWRSGSTRRSDSAHYVAPRPARYERLTNEELVPASSASSSIYSDRAGHRPLSRPALWVQGLSERQTGLRNARLWSDPVQQGDSRFQARCRSSGADSSCNVVRTGQRAAAFGSRTSQRRREHSESPQLQGTTSTAVSSALSCTRSFPRRC
jgi:hypothetical protein